MRELASQHKTLHLSKMRGDNEARSVTYITYVTRVLELPTKQFTKTSIGSTTRLLSRIEGCIVL